MIGWPSSIRVRLALWHSMLLGFPLVMFAIVSYVAFSRALVGGTDRFISEALSAFSRELSAERRAGLSVQQAIITTIYEVRFRELHIMIMDSSGRTTTAALPDTARAPSNADNARVDDQIVRQLRDDGITSSRSLASPVLMTLETPLGAFRARAQRLDLDGASYLLMGRYPLRETEQTMVDIRRMYSLAIPLLIIAAAVSGYLLALRSLAPVASMAERAAEISATNLHARVPVGGGDELVRLALIINDLLDRLQRSFDQQRRFMADASHELRTPTAIVRTEADVTLSQAHRSEPEYRESVGIMQDAARRLTRIVDDLFLLARSDAGHLVVHRAPLHLEDVVDDATRGVRQLADRRHVQVKITEAVEAPVFGDADLLGRLLLNLLDNAIKHSPVDGDVTVIMTRDANRVRVAVTDQGPGIPADSRDRVFERFFRVDAARTRQETSHTSGAGLGLAIARRIAEVHDGALTLDESAPGRTVFMFDLPLIPGDAPRT